MVRVKLNINFKIPEDEPPESPPPPPPPAIFKFKTTAINYRGHVDINEEDTLNCVFENDSDTQLLRETTNMVTVTFEKYLDIPTSFDLIPLSVTSNERISIIKYKIDSFYLFGRKIHFRLNTTLMDLLNAGEYALVDLILDGMLKDELLSHKNEYYIIVLPLIGLFDKISFDWYNGDSQKEFFNKVNMSYIIYLIISKRLRGCEQILGENTVFVQASLLDTYTGEINPNEYESLNIDEYIATYGQDVFDQQMADVEQQNENINLIEEDEASGTEENRKVTLSANTIMQKLSNILKYSA